MYCLVKNINTNESPRLVTQTFPTAEDAIEFVKRYKEKTPYSRVDFAVARVIPESICKIEVNNVTLVD